MRAAAQAARDALAAGDLATCDAILDAMIEGEVEYGYAPSATPAVRCPHCTLALHWHGELEHHLAAVHHIGWDEIEEATRAA